MYGDEGMRHYCNAKFVVQSETFLIKWAVVFFLGGRRQLYKNAHCLRIVIASVLAAIKVSILKEGCLFNL